MVNYLSFCPTCTKAFKTFPLTEKDRLDLYDKFMSLTNIKQDTNLFKLQSSTNHYVSKKNKLSFYTTYFHIEELY